MVREMDEIIAALKDASKELFDIDLDPQLSRTDEQFGDFSSNVAMQLAARTDKNPGKIATAIVQNLKGRTFPILEEVEIAGPGFINMRLSDAALWRLTEQQPGKSLAGKVIVAEYSDPNPFKVLHAGHLYTTITGDAIARLLEAAGAKVHRLNYGGDVGRHVRITMWAILRHLGGENPEKLKTVDAEERLEWLSERYVEGNNAYENDEQAKAEIIDISR